MKNILLTIVVSLMTIMTFAQYNAKITGTITNSNANEFTSPYAVNQLVIVSIKSYTNTSYVYLYTDNNGVFTYDTVGNGALSIKVKTVDANGDTIQPEYTNSKKTAFSLVVGADLSLNTLTIAPFAISAPTNDPTTSISDASQTQNTLYYSNNTLFTNSTTYIFSISGQLVKTSDTNIDVSDLKSGVYFAKTSTGTLKFVK